jgi:hypothetical protein
MGAGVEIAMKTPSLPLLALAAALSSNAAADDAPARRCTAAWLTRAASAVSNGTTLPADDKSMISVPVTDAAPRWIVNLDAAEFPCDAPLKHFLAVQGTPSGEIVLKPGTLKPTEGLVWKWNDEGLSAAWQKGFPQQVGILTAVDQMYSFVDPRGVVAIKAADDVVDAAVALGVAAKATDNAGLTAVKTANYTSPTFAAYPVYSVAAPTAAPATAPADLKVAIGKLFKDKPSKDPKAAPTVVVGPAVLTFRKAIIDLADELATRAAGRELLAKQNVDGAAKFDFVPGAGVAAFKALGAVKDAAGSPAIPDAVAEKDENYKSALAYLVGTDPIKDGSDVSTHDSAALSRFDYGLRNLIATRAAAVDAAVDAARKKVTTTVKAAQGTIDHDAKAVPTPTAGTPDLAAGVLAKLNANPDMARLNKIFENADNTKADPNSPDAKWAASPDGIAARAQRDQLIADAKATKVANGQLAYRVGTTDLTSSVRVPGLTNAGYRGAIEDAVLVAILNGDTSAKYLAAYDAFKGKAPVPDVPPVGAKIPVQDPPPPPPPAKSAWQTVLGATPEPSWYNTKDARAQTYLSSERAAAAEDADKARQARMDATRKAQDARDAMSEKCDDEKAEIASRPADPLWKKAVADKWRSDLLAAKTTECAGRIQGAYDDVMTAAKLTDPLLVAKAKTDRETAADNMVKQAYVDGIKESIDELHKEYRDANNERAKKAADESGFMGFYGKHLDLVDGYFTKNWDGTTLPVSTKSCSDILWHPGSGRGRGGKPAVFKDPNVSNVDDFCVHVGLVTHLKGYIGTGDAAK